ncbi:glycosyltransferase [Colwellia sp. TT2012]|uniref:glycosyltransferase n=1 Tax=Colwellia sp. TT2012 TaxID=1720342 RepID=UPI00070A3CAC|nr:glycosyltransferase [Colwellia sp. TT2012]
MNKKIYLVSGVLGLQAYSTRVVSKGLKEGFERQGWNVVDVVLKPKATLEQGKWKIVKEVLYRYFIFPRYCKKIIPKNAMVYIADHADATVIPYIDSKNIYLHMHDLTSLRPIYDFPYKVKFKNILIFILSYFFKRPGIKKAKHIFAISNFTKQEIIKYLNVERKNISVAYNGVITPEFNYENQGDYLKKIKKSSDKLTIMTVGPASLRKNYQVIVKALLSCNNSINWVHVGKFDQQTRISLQHLAINISVSEIPHIENIGDIYQRADILIQASLYEGFGLPPIEAMRLNTAVFSYDIPVAREVYQEHAKYFENENELLKLINNYQHDKVAIEKAFYFSQKYNWITCSKLISKKITDSMY